MPNWEGFGSLDLTDVQESGLPRLRPGAYIVTTRDAKLEAVQNNANNRRLTITFIDEENSGQITFNFNVANSSEQAQEIGLRQLKSFLVCAGHPNPNKPGDVRTLNDLRVGILVDWGDAYTDRNGKRRESTEIKRFFDPAHPVAFKPMARGAAGRAGANLLNGIGAGSGQNGGLDDEIPF